MHIYEEPIGIQTNAFRAEQTCLEFMKEPTRLVGQRCAGINAKVSTLCSSQLMYITVESRNALVLCQEATCDGF